jgi:tRNA (adenine57-N1/adenine58-N1)-methyltransferase
MVGKPYGSQFWSVDGKRHLHLLRPTPELWTRVLPHRTQILYLPDISFIIEKLDLTFGSIVIESGTGSGSFSHSIVRAIGSTGHLHTFDFHKARAEAAKTEFEEHGLASIVTARCRDVCNDGFDLDGVADAGFLQA